ECRGSRKKRASPRPKPSSRSSPKATTRATIRSAIPSNSQSNARRCSAPSPIGDKPMAALEGIRDALGLDDAGVDFAVCPDCDLLLFEANATMVVALLRRSIASLRSEEHTSELQSLAYLVC